MRGKPRIRGLRQIHLALLKEGQGTDEHRGRGRGLVSPVSPEAEAQSGRGSSSQSRRVVPRARRLLLLATAPGLFKVEPGGRK
jgi:hypothetical protein